MCRVEGVLCGLFFTVSSLAFAEDKLPIPGAAAQAEALKTIKEVFKDEYARTKSEDKLALAEKLTAQGAATRDDPITRFVLLQEGANLAAQLGQARMALQAIDAQAATHAVDEMALKASVLDLAARAPGTPDSNKDLALCCLELLDAAVACDNYDVALKVAAKADSAARKAKDMALVTQVQSRAKDAREMQAEFGNVKAAREILQTKPEDAAANLTAGKFLCLVKGQWAQGLPLLAKCGEPALKALAGKEAAAPTNPADQSALADAWWDWSEKQTGALKVKTRERAVEWYSKAEPQLSGFAKAKAEKRMQEEKTASTSKAAEAINPIAIRADTDWSKLTTADWERLRGTEVEVDARSIKDTDITVREGEQYLVLPHPDDKWATKDTLTPCSAMFGHVEDSWRGGRGDPLPGKPAMMLAIKVGDSWHKYGLVSGKGLLLLGPNDRGLNDNSGKVRVKIVRVK